MLVDTVVFLHGPINAHDAGVITAEQLGLIARQTREISGDTTGRATCQYSSLLSKLAGLSTYFEPRQMAKLWRFYLGESLGHGIGTAKVNEDE